MWFNSDPRKDFSGRLGVWGRQGDSDSEDLWEVWGALSWRPTNALSLELAPSHGEVDREMQYITTSSFGESSRYLFGALHQETTVLTLRLDYTITPDLTVQLYAQPFISTGRYERFKRITDPRAAAFRDRFDVLAGNRIAFDPSAEGFEVDENQDGQVDYDFSDPDFDVREFNSNLVVRWQYSPGSAVFLVWSQGRFDNTPRHSGLNLDRQLSQLFSAPADDVVLLKISKWFSP